MESRIIVRTVIIVNGNIISTTCPMVYNPLNTAYPAVNAMKITKAYDGVFSIKNIFKAIVKILRENPIYNSIYTDVIRINILPRKLPAAKMHISGKSLFGYKLASKNTKAPEASAKRPPRIKDIQASCPAMATVLC